VFLCSITFTVLFSVTIYWVIRFRQAIRDDNKKLDQLMRQEDYASVSYRQSNRSLKKYGGRSAL